MFSSSKYHKHDNEYEYDDDYDDTEDTNENEEEDTGTCYLSPDHFSEDSIKVKYIQDNQVFFVPLLHYISLKCQSFFECKCNLVRNLALIAYLSEFSYRSYKYCKQNKLLTEDVVLQDQNTYVILADIIHNFFMFHEANNTNILDDIKNTFLLLSISGNAQYFVVVNALSETLYIIVRGTKNISDLYTDAGIFFSYMTDIYSPLIQFLNHETVRDILNYYMEYGYKFVVCGHSLGGTIVNEFNKHLFKQKYKNVDENENVLALLKNHKPKVFVTLNRGTSDRAVTTGKESYDTYSMKRSSKKNTRYYQIDIVSSMDLISKGVKLNTNNDIIILNTTCDITVPAMPALQQKKLSDTSYMNQMWIGHKLKLMLTTLYTYFDYLCMYS